VRRAAVIEDVIAKWDKKIDELTDNAERAVVLEIWQWLRDQSLFVAGNLIAEALKKPVNKRYRKFYREALKDLKRITS
jgi:hypothetical protein